MTTSRRSRAAEDEDLQAVTAPDSRTRARERAAEDVPPVGVSTSSLASAEGAERSDPDGAPSRRAKTPLYPRLLRLRHVHPNAWQRAALGEGAVAAGVLLSMADLATAWSIVALPVAVAVVVKAHDALQGLLDRGTAPDA